MGIGTTAVGAKLAVTSTDARVAHLFLNQTSRLSTAVARLVKADNDSTTSNRFVEFEINSVTGSGMITANGTGVAAFGSYSDIRLKKNIVNLPSQLNNIMSLRPVEFDYKTGGHQIGFIAQEMQQVYPDVVGVGQDEMLTVTGWSKTEARLVKAIQELKAQNDALLERVTALEGAIL